MTAARSAVPRMLRAAPGQRTSAAALAKHRVAANAELTRAYAACAWDRALAAVGEAISATRLQRAAEGAEIASITDSLEQHCARFRQRALLRDVKWLERLRTELEERIARELAATVRGGECV